MIKAVVGLLTAAVSAVVLAALGHILAALIVAVVSAAVAVTLLIFTRRGLQNLARVVRRGTRHSRSSRRRVR